MHYRVGNIIIDVPRVVEAEVVFLACILKAEYDGHAGEVGHDKGPVRGG